MREAEQALGWRRFRPANMGTIRLVLTTSSPSTKSVVALSATRCWATKLLCGAPCCVSHRAAAFYQRAAKVLVRPDAPAAQGAAGASRHNARTRCAPPYRLPTAHRAAVLRSPHRPTDGQTRRGVRRPSGGQHHRISSMAFRNAPGDSSAGAGLPKNPRTAMGRARNLGRYPAISSAARHRTGRCR